ncbi:MAG TPA: zinc-binding dehydrogenase [Opitutaceae bacterium]|nr:zinc-binding dehydrogenase [Opitutaceae bacterium]
MKTHLAAVLASPRTFRLERRSAPPLGPREVRVRLEGSGVCASSLPVWEGRSWFSYPLPAGAPGHEGWGRLAEVGSEVTQLRPGDRVALLSSQAFAETDTAGADSVVPLPPELNGQPFPGEALGCAMNAFERSRIVADEWVAIVGLGFLGALLTQLATGAGARVIAVSRREFSLSLGRRMGASETVQLGDRREVAESVREITGGHGCPCVIEATGLQAPLDVATDLTAERGRLVIAGYHQDGLRHVDMQVWNWRGLDVINAHERAPQRYIAGIRAAVEAVANARLNPLPLYTHRVRLDELSSAFAGVRERPDGFLKALATYE